MSTHNHGTKPLGIDVSRWQPTINWARAKANGVSFVYIKATEGTRFISSTFSAQYTGATRAGLLRGAYHFARPDKSGGRAQAEFFLAHGGGWSADGMTLPGALDLEYNPYGAKNYGLTKAQMVAWVKDFSDTYHGRTGRYPVIYTTTDFWTSYAGNSAAFGRTNALWIARYAPAVGALPGGWSHYTFWQYSDNAAPNPGDADVFNGNAAGLRRFAKGH